MPKYNLKKDALDTRDHVLSKVVPLKESPPKKVDLRPLLPPIVDQGALSSCTACAVGAVHQLNQKSATPFAPSRLFLWWNTRNMEGVATIDTGVTMRGTFKAAAKFGMCPERMWPYDPASFTTRPTPPCYSAALESQVLTYARVKQTQADIERSLANKIPVVFGMLVFKSFESNGVARTGKVPMPDIATENILGAHAVVLVGYNSDTRQFIVRNSWGPAWGDKGYCYIPYSFILDPEYCFDFWAIYSIEQAPQKKKKKAEPPRQNKKAEPPRPGHAGHHQKGRKMKVVVVRGNGS